MCDRLKEVLVSARAVIASLDVASLSATEAAAVFESAVEMEKLFAGVKVLVAPKIGQSESWARAGYRSPEEWMARTAGTSIGQAKATWIDDEGMTAGRFRLTPEVGAAVINKIRAEADRHYRQAKDGQREDSKNYAADAFAALVTGDGLIGTKSKSNNAARPPGSNGTTRSLLPWVDLLRRTT